MRNNTNFSSSIFIYFFIIILSFFVLLIYIEDIYIFRQIEKINEIASLVYIGRVLIAISFSLMISVILYLYVFNFTKKLKNFSKLISEWGRGENPEDSSSNLEVGYNEINNLYRVFVDSCNNNLERQSNYNSLHSSDIKNNLSLKILPNIYELKLTPIKNLDISILPNKSSNTYFDILDIIETNNGCIVCLTGSPINDLNISVYKLKIQTTLSLIKSFAGILNEELFYEIFSKVLNYSEKMINLTLCYISKEDNKFIYHKYQKNQILFINNNTVDFLFNTNEEYLSKSIKNSNPIGLEFNLNNYILIISDRIRLLKEFLNDEFLVFIKENLQLKVNEIKSSKDLLIQLVDVMELWQGKNSSTGNIYDYLSCVAIRKK
jgi:Arg-Lys translocation region protein phosphatase